MAYDVYSLLLFPQEKSKVLLSVNFLSRFERNEHLVWYTWENEIWVTILSKEMKSGEHSLDKYHIPWNNYCDILMHSHQEAFPCKWMNQTMY